MSHALDDGGGAELAVAAGEDALARRHEIERIGLDGGALGPLDARLRRQHLLVRLLADGGDERVAVDGILAAGDGDGAAAAGGVRLAKLHALELDAGDASLVVKDDARGGGEELKVGAFVLAVLYLLEGGAHLFAAAAVDRMHLRAEAQRGARAVEGGEAAANDDDLFGVVHRLGQALRLVHQEADGVDEAGRVLALQAQLIGGPGADGEIHRVEARVEEVVHGEVFAELDVVLRVHTELPDAFELLIHHVLLQAVLRDAIAQHAAGLGHHVEDLAIVALQRQVIGGGQAAGAGADDGDLLAGRRL